MFKEETVMELVEAVFYKKINPGDLLNIDRAIQTAGGGQTYLDLAGISEADLSRFLEYGTVIPRERPQAGDDRLKYGIQAIAIGTNESKQIEFDPRNNRPNYKLSDQRNNRHPAWTSRFGFPVSPVGARRARDVTNIPNLVVYIIRTNERKYYAGFVNAPAMPNEWPVGIGLEKLFTGTRKGVLFLNQHAVAFMNDPLSPFSIITTVDTLDLNALPADIATQTNDAVEYLEDDLAELEEQRYNYVERPLPAVTVNTPQRETPPERHGRHVDHIRAQRNRIAIGKAGERAVFEYEKQRLTSLGREDLACRVEWVAETQGDGLGYDIHSFDVVDGLVVDRYIEVKTTTGAINKPFDVTLNEVEFSAENPGSFVLFRIFEYSLRSNNLLFYKALGSLSENFHLSATNYLASIP